MRLLSFHKRAKDSVPEIAGAIRHTKTHCEACAAPAVRRMRPPADGQVHLVCLTCDHEWCMADRRRSLRTPES